MRPRVPLLHRRHQRHAHLRQRHVYPAPLVLPGASRFDQLLQLTERLVTAAEHHPPAPHDQPVYAECLQKLKEFLLADPPDAPECTPSHTAAPPTASTCHRPSTDLGIDLVGYSFTDRALGQCKVVGPSTYTDEDNITWNTLEFTSTTYPIDLQFSKVSELRAWIIKDKNHHAPVPVTTPARTAPQRLTQGPIPDPPLRAILQAPNMTPPQPIHRYDLRSRRGDPSAKRIRRTYRDDRRAYAAALPIPEAYIPPALNLDVNGKPPTYRSAKNGPDRLIWERAEADELIQLLNSSTIVPIRYDDIPEDRIGGIVYYNPVVKQKRNDDGSIKCRVRGTASGDHLTVPYDVSARTASLETVKMLIQSVVSSKKKWRTLDVADFYLGTPLPPSRYEYIRISTKMIPDEIMKRYMLYGLERSCFVYFEIRRCMYGLPQAGRLSQIRLIERLARHGYHQCPNTPCLFRHRTRDIIFSLVVDDFSVRYGSQSDIDHLEAILKRKDYKITVRPDGDQYLGMAIAFNAARTAVTISMPGYVQKMLTRFRPHYLDKDHRPARTPGRYIAPV
jgi:hypothetical protein